MDSELSDRVIARLKGKYGALFSSQFEKEDAKMQALMFQQWSIDLAGMSVYQIQVALSMCDVRSSKFPPSTKEFRDMGCGIPDFDNCLYRVENMMIIDPLTRLIISNISAFDLKQMDSRKLERVVKVEYEQCYKAALNEVLGMNEDWKPPVKVEQQKPEFKRISVKRMNEIKQLLEQ